MPFAPPVIGAQEIAEVVATLKSGWLSTGPRVAAFERAFAEYTGAEHAIALSSCTAALHLSLLAARIGAGDEVVTTPLTFCATANAIVHTGARPVFADIDPETFNLDASAAAAAITGRTRAVLPVHFAGRPVQARLLARGVSTSVHFRALHLHPYYQERFALRRGMFPAAEAVSDTTLSLPLSAGMTPETVERMIEAVHESLR